MALNGVSITCVNSECIGRMMESRMSVGFDQ